MTDRAATGQPRGSVTISASYGALGDQIGRLVAERLGLAFLDRAIPAAAARRLNLSELSAERLDERPPNRWDRIFSAMASAGLMDLTPEPIEEVVDLPIMTGEVVEPTVTAEGFRLATERVLREVADTTGAVILGRAGMVVLRGRLDVLCVRLDGPVEARIANAVASGVAPEVARATQREVDGVREGYVHSFYKVRGDDPSLYQLVVDSTALGVDATVDIIVRAAEARFAARG